MSEKRIMAVPEYREAATVTDRQFHVERSPLPMSINIDIQADNIYFRVESYIDAASDTSSVDEAYDGEDAEHDETEEDDVQHNMDEQNANGDTAEIQPFTHIPLSRHGTARGYTYLDTSLDEALPPPTARVASIRTKARNERLLRRKTLPKTKVADPDLVTWESADDPANPHNWPQHRKWTSTVLIAAFAFIAPMASTIVAPALNDIADEFKLTKNSAEEFLVMSIFLLAFAIGPFLWGEWS